MERFMIDLRIGTTVRDAVLYAAASLVASALCAGLAGCGNGGGAATAAPTPPGVSALTGSDVFVATGTAPNAGDYSVVGSFIADGKGNITSGVADYNLGSGVDYNVPLSGSYTASSGSASITLTDGGSVKDTFMATLGTAGETALSNFDGSGSGFLFPQTTSGFVPAGTYSFSLSGEEDGVVSGSGQLVAAASGAFTSGSLTFTNGSTASSYSSVIGLLGPTASSGRGFANIEGTNMAYYVIGPNQIQFMGLDPQLLVTALAQKM